MNESTIDFKILNNIKTVQLKVKCNFTRNKQNHLTHIVWKNGKT